MIQGSLTRATRPTTLQDYIGNESLKKNLIANLSETPLPQMIMLNGLAGNGKTTLARLIAKAYFCENHTFTCNTCESCKQFDDYILTGDASYIQGLYEIDCASRRGVEDVAGIVKEALSPSFFKSWRIWIFDECHRLSEQAQSHLLKIVEEPPENVLFIFCTTNPEQIIDTLLSRMNLTYTVNLSNDEIIKTLKSICDKKGIKYHDSAIKYLAKRSQGIFRKALNNLESFFSESSSSVLTIKGIRELYGDLDLGLMRDLFKAYIEKNTTEFIIILNDLEDKAPLEKLHESVLYTLKLGISIKNGVVVDDLAPEDLKDFKKLFDQFSSTDLCLIFALIVRTKTSNITNALLQAMLERVESLAVNPIELNTNDNVKKEENAVTKRVEDAQQQKIDESISETVDELFSTIDIDFD